MRPHSRLWWYRRFRKAYKKHGVTSMSRRETWEDAQVARRNVDPKRQRELRPIT